MNILRPTPSAADWRAFHATNVRRYLAAWRATCSAESCGIARDEAAYYLLEHTALLWRYTADDNVRAGLLHWPRAQRSRLVYAACRYLQQSSFSARAAHICRIEALSDDDMHTAETLMLERDGMQAMLDLAHDTIADILPTSRAARFALAGAISSLSEGDDALLQRPDIISVASRILEPLRELIKVELNQTTYWWLYHARQLDARFEKELAAPAALALALRLPPKRFPQPKPAPHPPKPVIPVLKPYVFQPSLLSQLGAFTQLQAAKTLGTHTILRFINADLQTVLKNLGKHPPSPSPKKPSTKPLPCAVSAQPLSARMTIPPCPLLEQPKTAMAQWVIPASRTTPRHPCLVLVVNSQNGKIIGAARLNPTTNSITLQTGAWRDFASCANKPHALFLLALTAEPLE